MTVYIEYAFLQNFLFDGLLTWLSLRVARVKPRVWRLICASAFGGIFALVYPFLTLNSVGLFLLKTAVALGITWMAYGRIKTAKDRGRYALSTVFFFVFTFVFGGVMVYFGVESGWGVLFSFVGLTAVSVLVIRALKKRAALRRYTYSCKVTFKGRTVDADGFFDSGNGTEKFGVPVCFLSPDLAFDLFDGFEKNAEKLKITTLAGEKETRLYLAHLKMYDGQNLLFKGDVYFAPSVNMIRKEYKLLLNRALMEGERR